MKKRKLSFKRIALVASLALAGILGVSGIITKISLSPDNFSPKEASASGIYEGDYRVIYYYIDSNWQYGEDGGTGRRFERYELPGSQTAVGDAWHYFTYTNGGNATTKYFNEGSAGDDAYSVVFSDCAAKIYIPKTTSEIYFGSTDGNNNNYIVETQQLSANDGKEAFVVTTNESQWSGTRKKQSGIWVSKYKLFHDYLTYIYFTDTGGWISGSKGPGSLETAYVWVSHTGSDGATITRIYKSNSDMLVDLSGFGGSFIRLCVSAKSGATVRLQKTYQTNPWNNYRSKAVTIPSGENTIVYIYGNTTSDSEQSTSTGTFLNTNDYLFFTPSSNWANASAGFRICTYGANDVGQENYEAMTLLTVDKFGGLFTNSSVYYYRLKKPCYNIMFLRWDPNYMGNTSGDKDTSHQWNYSGKCSVTTDKYWVNMGSSDWYNTWTTSDSSGVSWQSYGDLKAMTTDQEPTNDTTRVFFYNSGTHWSSGGKCALRTWGHGDWNHQKLDVISYVFSWFQDDNGTYYGYSDIPLDISGCQIVKLDSESYNATNSYYQSSADFDLSDAETSCVNSVLYGAADGNAITRGGAHDDVAGGALLSKVLAACNTCSDNRLNGYNSYDNLNYYFYSHATGISTTTCKSMYGNVNYLIDYHFALIASRKASGAVVNYQKSNVLLNLFGQGSDDSSNTIIIIVVSSISILSITTLSVLLVKKRKTKEQ